MYKKTTLDSINRTLREQGLYGVEAAKDPKKVHSFVLRFDSEAVAEEMADRAKEVVANLMGEDMWWGEMRTT